MKQKIMKMMNHTDKLFEDGVFGSNDNESTRRLAARHMSANLFGDIGFCEIDSLVQCLCELALFGKEKFNDPR